MYIKHEIKIFVPNNKQNQYYTIDKVKIED